MILRPVCWLGLAYITGETAAWGFPGAYAVLCLLLAGGFGIYAYQRAASKGKLFLKNIFLCTEPGRKILEKLSPRFFLLCLICFAAGYLNFSTALETALESDEALEEYAGQTVAISGKVSMVQEKTNSWFVYLEDCTGVPAKKLLICVLKEDMPEADADLIAGCRVFIQGDLELFEHPVNEGAFDTWMYYQSKGLRAMIYADTCTVTRASKSPAAHLAAACRTRILNNLTSCLSEDGAAVAAGMICGDRSMLPSDLKALYQTSGISHILAISGLHISFIGRTIDRLLRRLGVRQEISIAAALCGMLMYAAFTGLAVSAIRAVVMTGLALLARLFGRTCDRPISLILAALCILLPSPLALTQSGFLLSFAAAGSLLLCPPMGKDKSKSLQRGRRAAPGCCGSSGGKSKRPKLRPAFHRCLEYADSRIRRAGHLFVRRCRSSFFITIGMLPFTAWCFYQIPVYSMLLNLAVIPLMSVLFPAMLVIGLTGHALGPVSRGLIFLIEGILWFYKNLSDFSLGLPFAVLITGKPSAAEMLICALLFVAAALGLRWLLGMEQSEGYRERTGHEKWTKDLGSAKQRGAPGRRSFAGMSRGLRISCGGLLTLCVLVLILPRTPSHMTVTMVDVGQGDCFLIQLPTGENILIDGGSTDVSSVGTYVIEPLLKARGIRSLDAVFLTHMDSDHINGAEEMLEAAAAEGTNAGAVKIGQIFLPWNVQEFENSDELLELANEAGIRCYGLESGDAMNYGDLKILVLSPQADDPAEDENDSCLVLYISYRGFEMLFTGDAGEEVEPDILQTMQELGIGSCDLLKVGHHGSKYSTSEEFLEYVNPYIAWISCGEDNSYGHPHEELLERLMAVTDEIYITAQDGQTMILTDGNFIKTVVWTWEGGYNSRMEVRLDEIYDSQ